MADLVERIEILAAAGVIPHRCANHGPITSFYYRGLDANVVELCCNNFAAFDEWLANFGSAQFKSNPSGIDIDRMEVLERYHSGLPLDELVRVSIEEELACERVVVRFSAHFDAGEVAAMLKLFARDGVWKRADGDIHGVEQRRAFMERRPPGIFARHVLSNFRTAIVDADHAVVDCYIVVYRYDFADQPVLPAPLESPDLMGTYHTTLVRESGAWKIASHAATIEFKHTKKAP
jgi:hypothetical protein